MNMRSKVYKYKKSYLDFYCPLCGSSRTLVSSGKLTKKNYLQLLFISILVIVPAFKIMEAFSIVFFFIFWGLLEFFVRLYHRKEMICPYCGFDAAWYKKDVKVAKDMVFNFLSKKKDDSPNVTEISS